MGLDSPAGAYASNHLKTRVNLYLVVIALSAEKTISHKYVVAKVKKY